MTRLKQIFNLLSDLRKENPKEYLKLQRSILSEILGSQELKQFFIGKLTKDKEFIQEITNQVRFMMDRRSLLGYGIGIWWWCS